MIPRHFQRKAFPPALILGDDPVNVLGVARNLGRNGIPVSRLGAIDSPIMRSRYIKCVILEPRIDDFPDDRYIDTLLIASRQLGDKPVLFPLSDLHALKIARNASALASAFRFITSSASTTEMLINKNLFCKSLADNKIPHPATHIVETLDQSKQAADEIGYPVYLKPEISPLFMQKFHRKGLIAHDGNELMRHLTSLRLTGLRVIIQEIIPGDAAFMCGCAGFRTEDVLLLFCYRRIREFPPQFGNGSLIESVPSFVHQTRLVDYLGTLDYRGIFDAEFKLDPRDGVYKLIEINARSWWQNLLPTMSGLNIVKAAYDYAIERDVIRACDYRPGVKWVHLYNDFFAARESGLGFLAWVRTLRGEKVFDIYAIDDLRPFLSYLTGLAIRKASSNLRRVLLPRV